ncbi:MAG: DUF5050 domain-containing protein [Clostridiales bacterium]|nr:DUF5050 domain-containing protein [Clostridiales bacterium]
MEQKTNRLVMVFISVIAAVSLLAAVLIVVSPDDVPMANPYNRGGNLLNGGRIAPGDNILFFIRPDDGGIYSLFGDTCTRVGEDGDGPSFATAEGYVYRERGVLTQILYNGSAKLALLEKAENPLIVGRWIYYTQAGQLHKYRMDDGKQAALGIYPAGNYYVSARRIFYIGQDGKLWTAYTDGTENRLLADTVMTDFIIRGQFIYFRDPEGTLCWCNTANTAAVTRHVQADQYNYTANHLAYTKDGKLYAMSFSEQQTEQIGEGVFQSLSCDDDYLYYFDENSDLIRIKADGSEKQIFEK